MSIKPDLEKFEWLIPWDVEGPSSGCLINCLGCFGTTYVMDNHRAALWAWLRHLPANGLVDVLHIDRHNDCLKQNDDWMGAAEDIKTLNLSQFLNLTLQENDEDYCVIRWDNFLSIFIHQFRNSIRNLYMTSHADNGDPSDFDADFIKPNALIERIEAIISEDTDTPLILDIDLDYFVEQSFDRSSLTDESFTNKILSLIGQLSKSPRVICFTIALSPPTCGGWDTSKLLLRKLISACSL